jgi:predicted nuclease with RNAse H fold
MTRFSRRRKAITRVHSANLVGVVLGARSAGGSAIAVLNTRTRQYQALVERDLLEKEQSPKDKDVDMDEVLLDYLQRCEPDRVAIEGATSLPAAVLGRLPAEGTPDYLSRACDLELKLKGALQGTQAAITARAIYLKHRLQARGVPVDEVSSRAALANFDVDKAWLRGKRSYTKNNATLQRVLRALALDSTFKSSRGKLDTAAKINALACVLSCAAPPEDTLYVGDPTEGQIRVPVRRYWE